MKYLTWHRTESSRSSSSLNPLGGMNSDDVEELNTNLFENIGMIAGSHASTLDRLYAWERKLYDEVKVLTYLLTYLLTYGLILKTNQAKMYKPNVCFFLSTGESGRAERV